jgi:hypothetical protein
MFMTVTGLAFTSSFTLYLGDLFEGEVHVRAGTTRLRHALVMQCVVITRGRKSPIV